jgi:hypothetical protein
VHFGDVEVPGQYRNGGVVVLETGRLFGGDSGYYYTGSYELQPHRIQAEAIVVKHNPSWIDAFGDNAQEFKIDLSGMKMGDDYEGIMTRRDKPQIRLPIRLSRVAALP